LLNAYSSRALSRVWKADTLFMVDDNHAAPLSPTMLRSRPEFSKQNSPTRLNRKPMKSALAENYIGLPY
jgi:hypothetical protein